MEEINRRFSLDEDFMNHKTDDLLYGFMRSISTAKPVYNNGKQEWKEYLTLKVYSQYRKVIQNICGVTTQTLKNRLNKLIEGGLVEETTLDLGGDKPTTVFLFPYDYDGNYKLINREMLKYLIDTRNPQAIRVYLFLLDKFQWKKDYVFTLKELRVALGYGENYFYADSTIQNVLNSFKREGVINFTKERFDGIDDYGRGITTERMVLKFVAIAEQQLEINKN